MLVQCIENCQMTMKEEKFMAIGVKTEIYDHAIAGSFFYFLLTHSFHIAPIDELNGFLKYCKCLNNMRSEQRKNFIERVSRRKQIVVPKEKRNKFLYFLLLACK